MLITTDTLIWSGTGLLCAALVGWGATRHYRRQLTQLRRELDEARAAAAHHALWSEEQRMDLGRQVRALQTQVARLDALVQNEQKRASRGSTWALPGANAGPTAAAANPQLRAVNFAATVPNPVARRQQFTRIEGGRRDDDDRPLASRTGGDDLPERYDQPAGFDQASPVGRSVAEQIRDRMAATAASVNGGTDDHAEFVDTRPSSAQPGDSPDPDGLTSPLTNWASGDATAGASLGGEASGQGVSQGGLPENLQGQRQPARDRVSIPDPSGSPASPWAATSVDLRPPRHLEAAALASAAAPAPAVTPITLDLDETQRPPADGSDEASLGARWREPRLAGSTAYYSSRSGRLTVAEGGVTTSTEFDFAQTQPIEVAALAGHKG